MTEENTTNPLNELLQTAHDRRHFLKGAAVIGAGLGLGPLAAQAASLNGTLRSGTNQTVSEILDIAATAEAAAVTLLYHIHLNVNQGKFNTNGIAIPVAELVGVVRAILREEQDHLTFLRGAGAKPVQLKFDAPAAVLTNAVDALKFLKAAEEIFIAAYMTGAKEFARMNQPKLVQYAYQIGGTECEHRVLARAALGLTPPNDRSFERNIFPNSVSGAVRVLSQLGVLNKVVPYPGAAAVNAILRNSGDRHIAAGVIYRSP